MNKSVFITGASGGIGKACALRLAREGFSVAACYHSDLDGANKLEAQAKASGGKIRIYKLDLTDSEEISTVFNLAKKDFGGFDVVVNCAGVSLVKLMTDTSETEFDLVNSINYKSVYEICRLAVPDMVRNQKGSIINISSMWGVSGASCEAVYSASKAAVIGLTKALARELAPSNVRVNCIAPGAIDTKMNNNLSDEEKAAFAEEIPMGRFGRPEEIAGIVAFLAGDDSSYITAQVITADGGLT